MENENKKQKKGSGLINGKGCMALLLAGHSQLLCKKYEVLYHEPLVEIRSTYLDLLGIAY